MNYLSLCLIAKNEDDYLQEWVDYHILLGVEHFYIYDNDSAVSIRETLRKYVEAGWVTVVDIHGQGQQLPAYNHCLKTFGKETRWIGFIDTDEYLVPKTCPTLPEFLSAYEEYAGLAVSSLFFGSGNNRKKPVGGQITAYRLRTPVNFRSNRLVKTIVQPLKTSMPMSPHLFIPAGDAFFVNEDFQRIDTQIFPHHSQKIQLNHYYTRSLEEIEEKLQRGRGDAGQAYKISRFDAVNRAAVENDTSILDLLKKILPGENSASPAFRKIAPDNTFLLDQMHSAAWKRMPGRKPEVDVLAAQPDPVYSQYTERTNRTDRLLKNRDWDGILQAKAELIEMTPQSPVHYVDFASIAMQKGDYPLAWQAIGQAWKLAPQSQVVLQVMAEYYLRMNDFVWLEKISQMMISGHPKENTSYFPMAMSLLHQGQIEKGLELALNILPDLLDGSPYEQLRAGLLIKTLQPHLRARNEIDRANQLIRAAVSVLPGDATLFSIAIQMNLEAKKQHAAKEFLKAALQIHPANADLLALQKQMEKQR